MVQRRRDILGEQRPEPRMASTTSSSGESRAASRADRSAPRVFDIFFDLPHPGASKDSERARMIEPPELFNPELMAELYDASAISRLARFAFPEHDDHQHGMYKSVVRSLVRSFVRRRVGVAWLVLMLF